MENSRHTFKGQWITNAEFAVLSPLSVYHRQLEPVSLDPKGPKNRHILFRRSFFYTPDSGRVMLYISADDYYKLYINGQFVTQGPAPGYPHHYYYNTVDVTDFLSEGENVMAVHTYYQGLINRVWVSGDDRHGLLLDMVQNGKVILSSDTAFRCAVHSGYRAGEIWGYATQFAEHYTSGTPEEGFEEPDYDDRTWEPALPRKTADYDLYPQPTALLIFEKILPVSVERTGNVIRYNFGQVYVGYPVVRAQGACGDTVEVRCGQELEPDGRVRHRMRANCNYAETWTLSGKSDTLHQYDYKAFQYIELCLPAGCEIEDAYILARHYPFTLKAKPNTEDATLLRIWELCCNSMYWGVQEVIQDCMDREKGNYLGDGCYTALTHYALTHDPSQLKKLVDDSLRTSFINGGLMTCAACSFMQEIAEFPLMLFPTLVRYHELSGDTAYITEKYDELVRVLDFYRTSYAGEDGLLANLDKWCLGEWPEPYQDGYDVDIKEGKVCPEVHNVINAHYIGALQAANQLAKIAKKSPYCDTRVPREAFFAAFYDKEKHLFCDSVTSRHISLIGNAFPFMYGLFPEGEATAEAIKKLIQDRGFTRVMLFGAYPILEGLRKRGESDMIRECLLDEGAWLRMLREGARVTYEGWGRDCKWNTSLFHLTLSYAALFLL